MRMPRISIQNALYYVTSRGDNEENIFKDAADYNTYLDLIKKCKAQFGFKLFAYCLLPNHLHILIELKENSSISQIMHNLNSSYTKYFNKKNARQGHLLQERYKLILMEKTPYLADTTAYIHLNPQTIMPDKGYENYPYSSYPLYIGKENAWFNMQQEINEVADCLSGKDYADFVKDFYQHKSKVFTEEIRRKSVLGTDEFVDKVKTAVDSFKTPEEKAQPDSERTMISKKKLILISGLVVLVLVCLALYLNTVKMRAALKDQLNKNNKEISEKVTQERLKVYKDMNSRMRADKVSLEAMKKRLDIEKQKNQALADQLNKEEKSINHGK